MTFRMARRETFPLCNRAEVMSYRASLRADRAERERRIEVARARVEAGLDIFTGGAAPVHELVRDEFFDSLSSPTQSDILEGWLERSAYRPTDGPLSKPAEAQD